MMVLTWSQLIVWLSLRCEVRHETMYLPKIRPQSPRCLDVGLIAIFFRYCQSCRDTLLTYNIIHGRDFSEELRKARQIAEIALKTRSNTSKDVKHFGLKSMIANQILRKYGRNKEAKKISHVNLVVPNQGIFVDKALKVITIPCLKLKLCYHFSGFEKINQIEIGKECAHVSVTVAESQDDNIGRFIGVDMNATGHVAVVSNPETGMIWKLGKEANHVALKYREIRRRLQRQGKYRKVKQLKNRQQRLTRNLNHHISKKIVQIAKENHCGIRLERLPIYARDPEQLIHSTIP